MKDKYKQFHLLKKTSILIVEDDEDETSEYKELFHHFFKRCYFAKNGEEGYLYFIKYKPDIVITDYKLPTMNGLQMTENIRKLDKETPILLHTAYADNHIFLEAIRRKITSYILKPTNVERLLEIISNELTNLSKELEIKKERLLMQSILEEFPDPIMVLDLDRNILFANNLLKKKRYWKNKKIDNMKCYEALYGYTKPCLQNGYSCDSNLAIETKKNINKFHKNIDKFGNQTYFNIKTVPLKDEEENVYALLKVIQNKSNEIHKEERLLYKANYDILTNLPNRTLLIDRIGQSILRSNRKNKMFAILFIDLDDFKMVNDIYGHQAGDILLKMATKRMKSSIRKIDTLARFGGDEFVIILEEISNPNSITSITKDIISRVSGEYALNKNIKVKISCSIGIDIYHPNENKSKEILIKNSDIAMYIAKKEGKGRYSFYKEKRYDK